MTTPGATRLVTLGDAEVLTELLRANREFLAPWEPDRDDSYFTADGQRAVVEAALEGRERGVTLPHVILDDSGRLVGRITLNEIVRGPFQSCSVGYWVSAIDSGRGLATSAVRDIIRVAFDELGLHRIQAGTLLENVRSQRVLERNGFVRFGVAPEPPHCRELAGPRALSGGQVGPSLHDRRAQHLPWDRGRSRDPSRARALAAAL